MAAATPSAGPAAARPRSELRFVAVLVVATALGPMAMQIFLPALPAIQATFAVPAAAAQLAFSLSALAMAVATLAYGPLSDRYGRRPAMLGGLVVFLLGSAICAAARSIEALILGRIVQAGGGVAGMVLARAIIRDVYDRERSATMIAYVTMAMVVAPMVSPALGGVLTDALGWRAVFVLGGLIGLAVLATVWLDLRETAPRVGAATSVRLMLVDFAKLLGSRAFVALALLGGFSLAVFFGFLAAAPYLTITVYGRPPAEYGLFFILVSGAFMSGNLVAARVTRRVGVERMIVLGCTGSLAATSLSLGLALAGHWTPWAIFLPTAFGAFSQGLAMPNTMAAVVSVDPMLAGSASGLAGFTQMAIAAVVAQAVGSIQNGTPYPMVVGMATCAALALIAAVIASAAGRRAASGVAGPA